MWYGNITNETAMEAERLANQMKHDKSKAQIAKWVADAAFKKAKEQLAFRELVLKESNNGRAL